MQVLIQLNEIAIYLTQPSCDDDDGNGNPQSAGGTPTENDLEMASQFLHIALSHASGVVRGLLDHHQQNSVCCSSNEPNCFASKNHRDQNQLSNVLSEANPVAHNPWDQQHDHERKPQQLLHITGGTLHETCNAVCLLWYNLALIRSQQERWVEAQTNLSIVAAVANDQFLVERLLPQWVRVGVKQQHHSVLSAERCHHRPARTCIRVHSSASTTCYTIPKPSVAIHEEERQQKLNNSPIDAAAWQCIRSLQATTAILGTLFDPTIAQLLSTLGNMYASGSSENGDDGNLRHTNMALSIFGVTLTVERAVFGPTHPRMIATISSMVELYARQGHYGLAYQGLQEIHYMQLLRNEAPQAIASTLWDMGVLQYSRQENYPAALQLLQQALMLLLRTPSSSSSPCDRSTQQPQPCQREIAATLNSIGFVLHRMHRHQRALQYCTSALRMLRSPPNNATAATKDIFRTMYHIALLHNELGHSLAAFNYYEQAAEQATSNRAQLQQCELTELVKIFLLMARLAMDEDTMSPQRALQCCHQATESLVVLTAAAAAPNHQGADDDITVHRRFWMDLAELRLSCGDVHGGLQACTHLARHGGTCSCHYSYPEAFASAYYITRVAMGTVSAASA